jgi:hypothetical protein
MGLGLLVAMTSPNPANVDGILLPALLPSPKLPEMRTTGSGHWLARHTSLVAALWLKQSSGFFRLAFHPPLPLLSHPLTYGSYAFPPLSCLTQYMKAFGAWSAPWPCMPCKGVTPPSSSFPEFTLLLTPLLGQATKLSAGSAIS